MPTDTMPLDELDQYDESEGSDEWSDLDSYYEEYTIAQNVDAEVWLDGDDIARIEIVADAPKGESVAYSMRLTYSFGDDVRTPVRPDPAEVTDAATLPAGPFTDTTGLMEQMADLGDPVCDLDGDGIIDAAPEESPLAEESTKAMMDCMSEVARQQAAGKTLGELAEEGGGFGAPLDTSDDTSFDDDPSLDCMTSLLDEMPSFSDMFPTDGPVDPAMQACLDAMDELDFGAILTDPESAPEAASPPECEGLDDQLFGGLGTEPPADPTSSAEGPATTAAP